LHAGDDNELKEGYGKVKQYRIKEEYGKRK
jgi:hypothetical protein